MLGRVCFKVCQWFFIIFLEFIKLLFAIILIIFFFLVCVFIFEGLSASDGKSLRSVLHGTVGKIRFLTLTPSQFAERTAVSQLLSQDEAFAILMNISSPTLALPLPDGFTSSRVARKKIPEPEPEPEQEPFRGPTLFGGSTSSHVSTVVYFKITQLQVKICFISNSLSFSVQVALPKMYCIRSPLPVQQPPPIQHSTILDSTVTFTVDRDICILGAQVCVLKFVYLVQLLKVYEKIMFWYVNLVFKTKG